MEDISKLGYVDPRLAETKGVCNAQHNHNAGKSGCNPASRGCDLRPCLRRESCAFHW